ncbi:hypothetical protein BKA16_000636 [Gordonia humi]|uniref:Uncharacterized protein n=1 Tax=Gordonia humi TaxID=686429 RepID=A0A840EUQ7_9ACTN|nr:hypothetical protein [Gordonia humi]
MDRWVRRNTARLRQVPVRTRGGHGCRCPKVRIGGTLLSDNTHQTGEAEWSSSLRLIASPYRESRGCTEVLGVRGRTGVHQCETVRSVALVAAESGGTGHWLLTREPGSGTGPSVSMSRPMSMYRGTRRRSRSATRLSRSPVNCGPACAKSNVNFLGFTGRTPVGRMVREDRGVTPESVSPSRWSSLGHRYGSCVYLWEVRGRPTILTAERSESSEFGVHVVAWWMAADQGMRPSPDHVVHISIVSWG